MLNITDGGTIATTIYYVQKIKSQVPFATMSGLNQLALEAQADTENRLVKEKFTLRTPWYKHGNKFGFNINFAKKDNLEAKLGTQADWMKLQEDGGTKTPTSTKNVAIPERENLGISPDQKLAKGEKPRAITSLSGVFYKKMPSGTEGIWERTGNNRFPIKLLYLFKQSASIKARFEFVKTETALVQKRYSPVMQAALINAIASAR